MNSAFEYENQLKIESGDNLNLRDIHTFFADSWDLLRFMAMELTTDPEIMALFQSLTPTDKSLQLPKYQRLVARMTADYLERDFRKQIKSNDIGGDEAMDPYKDYERHVNE